MVKMKWGARLTCARREAQQWNVVERPDGGDALAGPWHTGRLSANRRGAINHTLDGGSAVRWRAGKLRRRWPIQLRAIVARGTLLWALQPIAPIKVSMYLIHT